MSRKVQQFTVFGIQYRTKQFSAARGVELIGKMGRVSPFESLADTEALHDSGEGVNSVLPRHNWIPLHSRESINIAVFDTAGIACPTTVLKAVVKFVSGFNFGFLDGWRGVQIPTRFVTGVESRDSQNIDPLLSALLQNNQASLQQLEEYYSLEDAFKMYDVIVSKSVNAALAQEAAHREAKSRRR